MEILLGTLAYVIVTFPLAVLWHMKIFRTKYMAWEYFGEDVKLILGLSSMVVQGVVLSYGYSVLNVAHASLLSGICYSLVMGSFYGACMYSRLWVKVQKLDILNSLRWRQYI